MLAPKRLLPSLSMLSIFEASVRTGSFSAAAEELCLSPSAVSRQIKCLEDRLGNELFVRHKKTARVTMAGQQYAESVRDALLLIAHASMDLKANPDGKTLNLAILPSLGSIWLMSKLGSFISQNPDVKINLSTKVSQFDFYKENIDAAIHYDTEPWPNTHSKFLMKEVLIPVCSPSFAKKYEIKSPESILNAPMIHLTIRPDGWEKWFISTEVPFNNLTGMMVDQFQTALKAACAGIGIALIPKVIAEGEVKAGNIMYPFKNMLETNGGYSLTWPSDSNNLIILERFHEWLLSEV
jgi:LysR family glycine cleavage system transcriptional activator